MFTISNKLIAAFVIATVLISLGSILIVFPTVFTVDVTPTGPVTIGSTDTLLLTATPSGGTPSYTYEWYSGHASEQYAIASDQDDALDCGGWIWYNVYNLISSPGTTYLRWDVSGLKQGETISAASVTLRFDQTSKPTGTQRAKIRGFDVDDVPNDFTVDQHTTALTSAEVFWDVDRTTPPNTLMNTPDISTIIQEIVDRPGFAGNYLVIAIQDWSGSGDTVWWDAYRLGNYASKLNIDFPSSVVTGETASTYLFDPPSTGYYDIFARVTDGTPDVIDSNHVLVTVEEIIPSLEVDISPATPNPILIGTPIVLTANPSGGSPPYTYQWYVDGSPQTGETATSFSFSSLIEDDYAITVEVTDVRPIMVASAPVIVSVLTTLPPIISIMPIGPIEILITETVAFTAVVSDGTPPYTVNWWVSDVLWDTGTYPNPFTFDPTMSWIYTIHATVIDNNLMVATSNYVIVTVRDGVLGISITPSDPQETPAGTPITFTAVVTGGIMPYTIEWYVDTVLEQTGGTTFEFSSDINDTYTIHAEVTDQEPDTAISNSVEVTVTEAPLTLWEEILAFFQSIIDWIVEFFTQLWAWLGTIFGGLLTTGLVASRYRKHAAWIEPSYIAGASVIGSLINPIAGVGLLLLTATTATISSLAGVFLHQSARFNKGFQERCKNTQNQGLLCKFVFSPDQFKPDPPPQITVQRSTSRYHPKWSNLVPNKFTKKKNQSKKQD